MKAIMSFIKAVLAANENDDFIVLNGTEVIHTR